MLNPRAPKGLLVIHMVLIVAVSLFSGIGCEGSCGCAEDEAGDESTPLAEEETRAPEEQAERPAGALGGPLAAPEDLVAERALTEGEGVGNTEGEYEAGEEVAEGEPEDDGYDPAALVPVEADEGDDIATGLRVLCVLTERVLEQHGADGDPGRLASLLERGLRPHPSFAVVDEVMRNMSGSDPTQLYPQIQAAALERGVPNYECEALQEVFRRFAAAGPN